MTHIEMIVWADANASATTQSRLRTFWPTLDVFYELDSCISHIASNVENDNAVILIVSGSFGQQLAPVLDGLPQLRAVYVYCRDLTQHIQWAKGCDKIGLNRVFNRESDLLKQLTTDIKDAEEKELFLNTVSSRIVFIGEETGSGIGVFAGNETNQSTRDLTEEKIAFVWFQVLTEILIQMPHLSTARDEMIEQWRQAGVTPRETTIIDEFVHNYDPKRALYWYTRNTLLYVLLNRALRSENIDNIYKFRMFIVDLHTQLNELFRSSVSMKQVLTVYRGQHMTVREIEKLRGNLFGLISMNSFVSTSVSETVARRFLSYPNKEQQEPTTKVLFKMTIRGDIAQQTNKPFADIQKYSSFPGEQEILLHMGTVFRIDKIEQQSSDFHYFHLTMCTGNIDPQHKALFDFAKEQLACSKNVNYSTYGKFLAAMSQFDSSIAYYKQILSQIPKLLPLDEIALATIHNDLAYAYRDSGRQEKAFEHYQIALKLREKQGPNHEEDLATTYSDFGWLLMCMDKLEKAIDFHQRALNIRKRILGDDKADTAMSYNCLGLALAKTRSLENLKRGLTYLEKALTIRKRCLPSQHPFLAMSYSSLGSYYEGVSDYFHLIKLQHQALEYGSQALDMHKKALSIYKNSLPPTHVTLGSSYYSVGKLYLDQKQWEKAIEHLTECATIRRKHMSDELPYTLHLLGQAYAGQGNYRQAITFYEDALTIAQKNNDDALVTEIMVNIERTKQKTA